LTNVYKKKIASLSEEYRKMALAAALNAKEGFTGLWGLFFGWVGG
jgi:hypothetical protein